MVKRKVFRPVPGRSREIADGQAQKKRADDLTCIPTHMLADLGFVAYHILEVDDYDGVPRLKLAYYLIIELLGKPHALDNMAGVESETVVLGKDLLGSHSLLLLLPTE